MNSGVNGAIMCRGRLAWYSGDLLQINRKIAMGYAFTSGLHRSTVRKDSGVQILPSAFIFMNKNNIKIRKAVEKDYKILSSLGAKTFIQAYQGKVKEKNMSSYVGKSFNKDIVLEEIRDTSFIFLIIAKNEKPIGYAKLVANKTQYSRNKVKSIELVRLYILKNYQGQGIGSKSLEECIKIVKKNKFKFIWLGVWEKNYNAIAFYKKSGFKLFGKCKFNFGTEIHNDLLMRKKIF